MVSNMDFERSYGRILSGNKGLPKFLMVNSNSEEFTIHAEALVRLLDNQEEYLRVKIKDRKPEKAKGYPGEIYGYLSSGTDDNKGWFRLLIYIGSAGSDIKLEKDKTGGVKITNISLNFEFYFPVGELQMCIFSIKTMSKQHEEFNDLRNYYGE